MEKVRIKLEPKKNVDLYGFNISGFGAITFQMYFVELGITRTYTVDAVMLKNWLSKNPDKTWKDYLKTELLRLYNLLQMTKGFLDLMKKEAEE